MAMAWIRLNLLLSLGVCVAPVLSSPDKEGFRRYATYVLQPRHGGPDRAPLSAAARTGSYNVQLGFGGGQSRTRRMGNPASSSLPPRQEPQFAPQPQSRHPGHSAAQPGRQIHISGVNVCGGQCCHGWSKTPGSQRCTKPNCLPQCQNGGMCLRPQLCVCKPGTKGKACEQKTVLSNPPVPGNGHNAVVPQRPIPQQASPHSPAHVGQMTLTVKQQPPVVVPPSVPHQHRPPLTMTVHQGSSQQFVIKPKYYQNHKVQSQPQTPERSIPLTAGNSPLQVGNHTGRIKVVFTPTICKMTCSGGKCQNNCAKGNTTTIISENGHAADTLTAPNFRVVVCHLPCMNGGQCSARDKCQCPPNFTGKFCQLPVQNGQSRHQSQQYQKHQAHQTHQTHQQHQQVSMSHSQTSQVLSTHTLPLTFGGQNSRQVKFAPNIVNIHVKHPPEASVQIHQVSQLDANGQKVKGSQSGHYTYYGETSQKGQHNHNVVYPNQQTFVHHYPVAAKNQLGRCFQETAGTQCGKALPGLSKQDDCCGSVGTSWGFHKCQKCPKKTYINECHLQGVCTNGECLNTIGSYRCFCKAGYMPDASLSNCIPIPLTGPRHAMDCPQGYKRINNTYCQDINECHLQGVCTNGECLNTIGSYRCFCKAGYMPDASLSNCIPSTPMVPEEKGPCFRFVSAGKQCMHPVSVQLSKQLCCCSVGKAWGPHCDKCPILGTAAFKEICPGGMGYTVTGTYRNLGHRNQPDSGTKIKISPPEHHVPAAPAPTVQRPVEALSSTERHHPEAATVEVVTAAPEQELVTLGSNNKSILEPGQPQLSPGISTISLDPGFPDVIEKTSPPAPVEVAPEVSTSSASQVIAPIKVSEVDECAVSPEICGPGYCINLPEGYTCICDEGFHMDSEGTTCEDVNECEQNPRICSNGHCENTEGSFRCVCRPGFTPDEEGTNCIDLDECSGRNICGDGFCENTMGSYTCRHCEPGYRMTRRGSCEDINECYDRQICPSGRCLNTLGSYECTPCPNGYEGRGGQCVDVNECLDRSLCSNGKCSNLEGYYVCKCNKGYEESPDGRSCTDFDECQDQSVCVRGLCRNTEGSFVCNCGPGFRISSDGDQCDDVDECQELLHPCGEVGQCVNNLGSYQCTCPDGYQAVNGTQCQDVDECLDDSDLCVPHGTCFNTHGSFYCICEQGFAATDDSQSCEDVDECAAGTKCHGGSCVNTAGSYSCDCASGYRLHAANETCIDIDECEEESGICGTWRCENALGSYQCIVDCPPGHTLEPNGICVDVDECSVNSTLCGRHGFCENTAGSFRCLCDQGFQEQPDGQGCVDVNECEMLSSVCGEALCDNAEGSFHCVCPEENQEFNQMTGQCSVIGTDTGLEKECYYNLNDENLCENVLATNVTKEECCCTLGAGWGDNCEIYPCPMLDTDQYSEMCPGGRGLIPTADPGYGVFEPRYVDADECSLYGDEICKGGVCSNTHGSFECYCKQGTYYDQITLQCVDIDECQDESLCIEGNCINTDGSYMCFCTHPMILDGSGNRCIDPPEMSEPREQTGLFQDICWQNIINGNTCNNPLVEMKTTFAECCCLFGEAWGMMCALCPKQNTDAFASLCNVPVSGGRREYGEDALTAVNPDYPVLRPDYDSQAQTRFLPLYEDEGHQYDAFEGLRAEECGILNGCENGRCVRVQQGYTCDCFDGYSFDASKMVCVDVNECSELNNKMSLCKNAKCINTQGSYKCVCLPGFVRSDRPGYCVVAEARGDSVLE
ncbi:latent-transforming growth factor beta-binding protein 1 isoform X2 [Amia ocellicauda]|uniref:latent-transforming growth factor beta-binding protein 1 isoform X2 n=1 Tax=Amia ocellicauda TaxID=2972642 RepID=UPI0034645C84